MANDLARKTEEVAAQDVDQRETDGPNDSPRIRQYLDYTGAEHGSPYCASACSTWVHEAAQQMNVTTTFKKSARALGLWERNDTLHIEPRDFTPDDLPCIAILDHDGIKGHAYLAIGYDPDTGHIQSIDPNASEHGGREGTGVYALNVRSIHDVQLKGFIRIA